MRFHSPQMFWLLLLLLPIGWRVLSTERFLGRLRRRFRADSGDRPLWRLISRGLLPLLGLACLVTALAGPSITVLRSGNVSDNLVLAIGIDVSKSMLAEDVVLQRQPGERTAPLSNRINAARRLALSLVEHLDGEKVGLFFFARNGIEVVSPTRDLGFLRYMITHTNLGDLTESGSNLLAALDSGVMMVESQAGIPAKAVILITDGEDTENTRSEIVQNLSARSDGIIPVFTVGVGHTTEVYIPIRRKGATDIDGFYMDNQDLPLKTRLDQQPLQEIAAATGGAYFNLGENQQKEIAAKLMQNITTTVVAPVDIPPQRAPFDCAPIFLLGSLFFYIPFLLL